MTSAYTNPGPFTLTAGEDLAADRMVKLSSGTAVYADAGNEPVGITEHACADGEAVSIRPINASGVARVTAADTFAVDAALYTANDGKVTDSAGSGRRIGSALQAATAAGDVVAALINVYSGDSLGSNLDKVRFLEDFLTGCTEDGHKFSETADKADWLKTSVDTDSDSGDACIVQDDAPGGILLLKCNDNALDSEQLQLNGESFKLAVGKPLTFRTRIAVEDADKITLFVGLALTDTTVLAGVTDRVGFQIDVAGADGSIDCLVEQDNTESNTDSTADISDGTLATFATTSVELEFYWDGVSAVKFFVDGVLKVTKTDDAATVLIPDDEALTPTIALQNSEGATQSVWVDYIEIEAYR